MQIPIIGTVILLFLYHLIFYHTAFGLGWLFFIIPVHGYLLLTHRKNQNFGISITLSLLATILYGLTAYTGNWFTQMLTLFFACFLTILTVFTSKLTAPFSWTFLHTCFAPLLIVLYGCGDIFRKMFLVSNKTPKEKRSNHTLAHLRGFIIALPVIIILFALFRTADPLYNSLVHTLFDTIWDRLFMTIFLGLSFLYIGSISLANPPTLPDQDIKPTEGVYEELRTFLGVITILIGTFILVEIRYLFIRTSETDLSAVLGVVGYTYSQYVTKGFFELIVASVIAGLSLLFGAYRYRQVLHTKKQPIQWLAIALGGEIIILIASALQRLQLYVSAHGLTLARGYGALFLLSLTIIIILCVLQYMMKFSKMSRYIFWSIPIFLFLIGLYIVPLDRLIATRFPPTVNGNIDYYYTSRLSVEAHPSWPQALMQTRRVGEELAKQKEWSVDDKTKLFWTGKTLGNLCASMTKVTLLFGSVDEIREIRSACLPYTPFDLARFNETGNFADLPKPFSESRTWQSFNYASFQAYQYLNTHKEMVHMIKESNAFLSSITDHFAKEWEKTLPRDRRIDPMFLN